MKEEKKVTSGGLEVYYYKNPAQRGFQISLFVRAGSMYESAGERGITHFLEHILIRNVAELMGGRLYPTLDAHGLELGASTYSEMVQFSVFGSVSRFRPAADIIAKLLCPITLSRAEVDAERARIKAEIRESGDRTSLASFTNSVVHKGTSLAESIAGTVAGVNKITAKRLEEYRRSVFTRDNVFFYVTGGVSDGDIDYLCRILDSFELPASEPRKNIAPVSAGFGKREPKVYLKNGDFTMARFTFDLDMSRVSVAEADLIYDVLLSGNNSRLFLELSERLGYCYDVAGNLERYSNIGTLSFYYELRESSLYDAVARTVDILKSLCAEPLPEDECMKAAYVDNAPVLEDDVRELNFTLAYDNHVMGLGYSDMKCRAECYRRITPRRLCEVAKQIFVRENLTLTVKGKRRRIDTDRLEKIISQL